MIVVDRLVKCFGSFPALDDVSLTIPEGKLVALLGPSGSGKTTLLRILAGLERPDGGNVFMEGVDASRLKTRDRRIGFVFQHYALFRHMNVADNVAFGLRVRDGASRPSKGVIDETVGRLLDLVHLAGFAKRYPSQLSGGQRQRVALARALAVQPRLLLLDEPFGALDAQVRKDLRRWLRHLHEEMGLTTVFVTHDQEEALELADQVVVMHRGKIEQIGTPQDIYDHPATPFVFNFLGNVNQLDCTVDGGVARAPGWVADAPGMPDSEGIAFIRPHDIEISGEGQVPATVRHVMVLGSMVRADLVLGDGSLIEAEISRDVYSRTPLAPGQRITLRFRKVAVFPSRPASG